MNLGSNDSPSAVFSKPTVSPLPTAPPLAIDEQVAESAKLASKPYSWIHPTLKLGRHPKHGCAGLFLTQDLPKGTPVVCWSGRIVSEQEMMQLPEDEDAYTLQIDDALYQVPINLRVREPADFTNSSCEPNCGFRGPITLVTMRDMHVGEEVLFDYAMSESNNQHGEFECQCGTASCRKKFTGDDWKLPEIQERYNGYFSPYLQRKVDQMRREREMLGKLNKLSISSPADLSGSERNGSEPASPPAESPSPSTSSLIHPICSESP